MNKKDFFQNLKALRKTTFMPYVVFIAPPSLQQLRRQKEILGQHGVKDEQLKLILNEGKTTEKVSIVYFSNNCF